SKTHRATLITFLFMFSSIQNRKSKIQSCLIAFCTPDPLPLPLLFGSRQSHQTAHWCLEFGPVKPALSECSRSPRASVSHLPLDPLAACRRFLALPHDRFFQLS